MTFRKGVNMNSDNFVKIPKQASYSIDRTNTLVLN